MRPLSPQPAPVADCGGGDRPVEATDFPSMVQAADEAWARYLLRNSSKLVDLFQGMLQSTIVCDTCGKESITFDPYM